LRVGVAVGLPPFAVPDKIAYGNPIAAISLADWDSTVSKQNQARMATSAKAPAAGRPLPSPGSNTPAARWGSLPDVGLVVLLFSTVFLAYLPALNGGVLWDDDAHLTKPALRSLHGLWRIWFDLGATQQY